MENTTINGKFTAIIYKNDLSSFTVAKFSLYEVKETEIIVTGNLATIHPNILYRLEGEYKNHPKYGSQFVVASYGKILPTDYESIINFLSSPLFPGIGNKAASKIVEELGIECISLIKEDASVLDKIKGISKKVKESLIQGLLENNDIDNMIAFFSTHGLGIRNIMKMEQFYGSDVIKLVNENPYRLIEDIDGIGFNIAEKIAISIDFDMHSKHRTNTALLSLIMELCMQSGDTYIAIDQLEIPLIKRLGHHEFVFDEVIRTLCDAKKIYIEQNRVYHATQYVAEIEVATFLKGLYSKESDKYDESIVDNYIAKIEEDEGINYEQLQKMAIKNFLSNNFSIITGGPGTGKTTIVKAMMKLYKTLFPFNTIALCAPTGRAAKRLSELANIEATTIHRLLKWNLEKNTFAFNSEEPLCVDLLVIDEFSMVDNWLFHQIVLASRCIRNIVVVGDENQLPSVASGCVLRDLIRSKQFEVMQLNKIYRQSEGSDIVTLAASLNKNEVISFDNMKEVKFYDCQRYDVRYLVLKLTEYAMDKGFSLHDIQVLAPKYSGNAGIDDLNRELQILCNPASINKKELRIGNRIFREGDKILQLKNQPEDDVYNGDIGILDEIIYARDDIDKKNHISVNFDGNIVLYSSENFINITHAYAISIHKSQGSEYQIIIMPIISDYQFMLTKKLIYTGITRAKKSLILLGSKELLLKTIMSKKDYERQTTLCERIIANFVE